MEDVFIRGWGNFLARTDGPMSFRFILQPAVASFLAIRAGLRDAREGRPVFFWSLLSNPSSRSNLIRSGLKDIGSVFFLALSLDVIYQLIVVRGVYLFETLFTASVLAIVPYVLLRGPISRIVRLVRTPTGSGNAMDRH